MTPTPTTPPDDGEPWEGMLRELETALLEAQVYGHEGRSPKLLQNGWVLNFNAGTYEPRYEIPNDTRWLGTHADTTTRHDITVTRPVTPADHPWMRELLHITNRHLLTPATLDLLAHWADDPPPPPTPWRSPLTIPAGAPLARFDATAEAPPWSDPHTDILGDITRHFRRGDNQ